MAKLGATDGYREIFLSIPVYSSLCVVLCQCVIKPQLCTAASLVTSAIFLSRRAALLKTLAESFLEGMNLKKGLFSKMAYIR